MMPQRGLARGKKKRTYPRQNKSKGPSPHQDNICCLPLYFNCEMRSLYLAEKNVPAFHGTVDEGSAEANSSRPLGPSVKYHL